MGIFFRGGTNVNMAVLEKHNYFCVWPNAIFALKVAKSK